MSDTPSYVLEREFNAPRELVWRAWTEGDLLARWYGPNVETVIHALDIQPGGRLRIEMRWKGGGHFERMDVLEADPPAKLVWLQSMVDADWNIATNPQMPDWPRVLHTAITFKDLGDRTAMKLVWTPHDASEAERAFFAKATGGADKGWKAGMDLLEELLAELQG